MKCSDKVETPAFKESAPQSLIHPEFTMPKTYIARSEDRPRELYDATEEDLVALEALRARNSWTIGKRRPKCIAALRTFNAIPTTELDAALRAAGLAAVDSRVP